MVIVGSVRPRLPYRLVIPPRLRILGFDELWALKTFKVAHYLNPQLCDDPLWNLCNLFFKLDLCGPGLSNHALENMMRGR